jgi:hypothetical protein
VNGGARGSNGKAAEATPSRGRPNVGRQAAWEGERAAWEARFGASKERTGLYPFTISGIPIKPLYTPEISPAWTSRATAYPGGTRSRAASTPRCSAARCSRCASSRASARA